MIGRDRRVLFVVGLVALFVKADPHPGIRPTRHRALRVTDPFTEAHRNTFTRPFPPSLLLERKQSAS